MFPEMAEYGSVAVKETGSINRILPVGGELLKLGSHLAEAIPWRKPYWSREINILGKSQESGGCSSSAYETGRFLFIDSPQMKT